MLIGKQMKLKYLDFLNTAPLFLKNEKDLTEIYAAWLLLTNIGIQMELQFGNFAGRPDIIELNLTIERL